MLKFFLTRRETPEAKELEKKTYLTIRGASGFLDESQRYFTLEVSQNQFIDPGFNFIQIEYHKPCLYI